MGTPGVIKQYSIVSNKNMIHLYIVKTLIQVGNSYKVKLPRATAPPVEIGGDGSHEIKLFTSYYVGNSRVRKA